MTKSSIASFSEVTCHCCGGDGEVRLETGAHAPCRVCNTTGKVEIVRLREGGFFTRAAYEACELVGVPAEVL